MHTCLRTGHTEPTETDGGQDVFGGYRRRTGQQHPQERLGEKTGDSPGGFMRLFRALSGARKALDSIEKASPQVGSGGSMSFVQTCSVMSSSSEKKNGIPQRSQVDW